MGLYHCQRCGEWANSEDDPPAMDPMMPAEWTGLVCGGCSDEINMIDLDAMLDEVFGPVGQRVRIR